ncbi:ankyrin repeat and fibronectin type-III domain-containing protein 1 isoform X3 [Lampetra fluviatilis]
MDRSRGAMQRELTEPRPAMDIHPVIIDGRKRSGLPVGPAALPDNRLAELLGGLTLGELESWLLWERAPRGGLHRDDGDSGGDDAGVWARRPPCGAGTARAAPRSLDKRVVHMALSRSRVLPDPYQPLAAPWPLPRPLRGDAVGCKGVDRAPVATCPQVTARCSAPQPPLAPPAGAITQAGGPLRGCAFGGDVAHRGDGGGGGWRPQREPCWQRDGDRGGAGCASGGADMGGGGGREGGRSPGDSLDPDGCGWLRKSSSLDSSLCRVAVDSHGGYGEAGKPKLKRKVSWGAADKRHCQAKRFEGDVVRWAQQRLSHRSRRSRSAGASPLSSSARPRSVALNWPPPEEMTQQMRDLQFSSPAGGCGPVASTVAPAASGGGGGGPLNLAPQASRRSDGASPSAAKRLYRNLSDKLRGAGGSGSDEACAVHTRSERERERDRQQRKSASLPNLQCGEALLAAVEQQDMEGVRLLLDRFSPDELDLNTPNSEGLVPLDIASMTNNVPMARMLLRAGARESPHFVSLESRAQHLSALAREAEQRVGELAAQLINEPAGCDACERQRQLAAWEWRHRLYKRMQTGFEHARTPDAPTHVQLCVTGSHTLTVSFQEPLLINAAIVTKYKVEWSSSSSSSQSFAPPSGDCVLEDLRVLKCSISNLPSGVPCYVRVSAYNMKGWGPPQCSVPAFAIPSNWRELECLPARSRDRTEALDQLLRQLKLTWQWGDTQANAKLQAAGRKHSVSKSLKHLFHSNTKFVKSMKRGLYLASVFFDGDSVLVTQEDQLPVLEVDDSCSSSISQDFLWFAKVSCMWDDVDWLRHRVMSSLSSCSSALQARQKILVAVSHMQAALGVSDLGRAYLEPLKDRHGNAVLLTLREVSEPLQHAPGGLRWQPVSRLLSQRKSLSTPEEPSALEALIITLQEKVSYQRMSSQLLEPGLYLGYLKLCSSVEQIKVLVTQKMPNMLCHSKIRDNPNVSREEWAWLRSVGGPGPAAWRGEGHEAGPQAVFQQQLTAAVPALLTRINVSLQQARDFRVYTQEVLELSHGVSFLLLMPPAHAVCTAPGQNPYTPHAGFLTLPLQIFELVHFWRYSPSFLGRYCRLSARLELESLLSQQALREALSDDELLVAKQRQQQVADFTQQVDEVWREARWLMDALQHARYKHPPGCGSVPLQLALRRPGDGGAPDGHRRRRDAADDGDGGDGGEAGDDGGEDDAEEAAAKIPPGAKPPPPSSSSSSSLHLDFLPSPAPSPEPPRRLKRSDRHVFSDEESSSEVFLPTDSDYESSSALSPRELDLVLECSPGGGRRRHGGGRRGGERRRRRVEERRRRGERRRWRRRRRRVRRQRRRRRGRRRRRQGPGRAARPRAPAPLVRVPERGPEAVAHAQRPRRGGPGRVAPRAAPLARRRGRGPRRLRDRPAGPLRRPGPGGGRRLGGARLQVGWERRSGRRPPRPQKPKPRLPRARELVEGSLRSWRAADGLELEPVGHRAGQRFGPVHGTGQQEQAGPSRAVGVRSCPRGHHGPRGRQGQDSSVAGGRRSPREA